MNKLYLIVFNNGFDRDKLTQAFDKNKAGFWFYNMPNNIFLKSNLSAAQIYQLIGNPSGEQRIFITEIDFDNMQGYLPIDHVQYFKH